MSERLVAAALIGPGVEVLDVGGAAAEAATAAGAYVWTADDPHDLPCPEESMDCVLWTVPHPPDERAVGEICRVVRPGGTVALRVDEPVADLFEPWGIPIGGEPPVLVGHRRR